MITVFTTRDRSHYNLSVKVDNTWRTVKFEPPVIHGNVLQSTFSTSDPKLTKALKEHPWFDKIFFVQRTIDDTPTAPAKVKTIEEELKDPDTAIRNESVTTKQMAIAFIQGSFSETFSAPNLSVEEMKREAARRWNVLFVKWGN